MAPPKTNLSVKLENVEVAVTNITEPIRKNRRTKGKCLLAVFMLLLIVGTILIFSAVHLYNHVHRKDKFDTVSKIHGRKIPEHLQVDYGNKIIYASNDEDGEIDGLVALHNYDKKMLAFKDLTNGRCYIDVLNETFEEGLAFWSAQEGKERTLVTRYFRYIREPIDLDVLRTFAGQHIADHCAGVPSHWIVVISKEEAERQEKYSDGKTVQFICEPNYVCPTCPTDDVPVTTTPENKNKQLDIGFSKLF